LASLGASLLPRNERKMLYMICMPAARRVARGGVRERSAARARAVDVEEALLAGDEAEVDEVGRDPVGPAPRHGRRQVRLDLVLDLVRRLALHEAERREEDDAEDGVPGDLVDAHLLEHGLHGRAGQHAVEEAVEVVAARPVPQQPERRHARGPRDVEPKKVRSFAPLVSPARGAGAALLLALDALLREDVAEREAGQRREGLDRLRCGRRSRVVFFSGPALARASGWAARAWLYLAQSIAMFVC